MVRLGVPSCIAGGLGWGVTSVTTNLTPSSRSTLMHPPIGISRGFSSDSFIGVGMVCTRRLQVTKVGSVE